MCLRIIHVHLRHCGETHGMLPRVSGITNAREHSGWVRNGGCFNLRVVVFCVSNADEFGRPSGVTECQRPCVAVSRPREWPWVGQETGDTERDVVRSWGRRGALPSDVVYDLSTVSWGPCEPVSYVCVNGRRQGLDQTVSALWVKGELGKFSRQWWQRYFEPAPRRLMMFTSRSVIVMVS